MNGNFVKKKMHSLKIARYYFAWFSLTKRSIHLLFQCSYQEEISLNKSWSVSTVPMWIDWCRQVSDSWIFKQMCDGVINSDLTFYSKELIILIIFYNYCSLTLNWWDGWRSWYCFARIAQWETQNDLSTIADINTSTGARISRALIIEAIEARRAFWLLVVVVALTAEKVIWNGGQPFCHSKKAEIAC
jgi:hypothetical protein